MAKYYDIDDIITEEETISVIFQKAASGVGIDPSAEIDFIEAGSKVELSFWLNVPPCFNQRTRLEIQGDSASVDLWSRCAFFYAFGCKIAPMWLGSIVKGHFSCTQGVQMVRNAVSTSTAL